MTEAAIIESATNMAALAAEASPSPLLLLSSDACVGWSNLAAQEWLGLSQSTLAKDGLTAALPLGVHLAELVGQAIESGRDMRIRRAHLGTPEAYSVDIRHVSGGRVLLSVSAIPRDERESRQEAALGFGRMLAHELKNPLASVRGAAQLIQNTEDVDGIAELSALIVGDVDRMTRLADHWSRIGDITLGETGPVNLNKIAVLALDSFRRGQPEARQTVEDSFDPSLPPVVGDADLLHQIILNLLQNSWESVSGMPDITPHIRLESRYSPGLSADSESGPPCLVLTVIDNGSGIANSLGADVFSPFVTTKPAGEGLGLAFASRIAALHGGQIDYESEPGCTRFNLRLPLDAKGRAL